LLRKARGILNKLCPQKFDILVEKFNELQIDTEEKLRVCMELVFEKVNILGFDLTEFC
jgi:translation initiation factor 4G